MLDQNAILEANDVRSNPVDWLAEPRKSSMHDDEGAFSHNRSGLIFESRRTALDETKQALATGSNVRAVLVVVRSPKLVGSHLGRSVEQRIRGCQDDSLVVEPHVTTRCL